MRFLKRRCGLQRISQRTATIGLGLLILLTWKLHKSMLKFEMGEVFFHTTRASFSWNNKGYRVLNSRGHSVLSGGFGVKFTGVAKAEKCNSDTLCSHFSNGDVTVKQYTNLGATCLDIHSKSHELLASNPMDCFDIGDARTYWYGGAENYEDRWPIKMALSERAQVSQTGSYGTVLERFWFNNKGVAIIVDDLVPLFVKAEGQQFCLIAKYDDIIYRNWDNKVPLLNYTICVKENVKEIYKYVLDRYVRNPIEIPDHKMIKYPVWSTWAKYKSFINQDLTIKYTNEIYDHGFPACQIELDDRYTINYGDYIFDPVKFPDPEKMIHHIHSKGFRLTVWTHPFSNLQTESYKEGKARGYWVMDSSGQTGRAGWWRGQGGVLDVTNEDAVEWYFKRLEKLHILGVDGHKYDAGEIGFLPRRFVTNKKLYNPNHYTSMYAELMYKNTNRYMQVRVGYKTQHLPIFVSMMDRNSDWGYHMGLKSLITTSLVFGSMGYYFIMPDMIGGNAYCSGTMDCTDVKPERELFIRWLQLTAFLPMMQFSFTPWQYDDEVVEIAKQYVNLHTDYVSPKIITLGQESMSTGYPIIRPMWWIAPDDEITYTLDSQFMIGNDLLVAPILHKSSTSRDVYLPLGTWKNVLTGEIHKVNEKSYILSNVKALLREIPYFERQ